MTLYTFEMIRQSDIMSLNTSDEGYNNGKKYGKKGAICGPNNTQHKRKIITYIYKIFTSKTLL